MTAHIDSGQMRQRECSHGADCPFPRECGKAGRCVEPLGPQLRTTFEQIEPPPFVAWYVEHAQEDAAMVWDKAKEYGGFEVQADYLSLLLGGRGAAGPGVQDGLERVIAFNCAQKLARIAESLARGQQPSLDSWRDLGAYAMIARRLRITHTWPA